MAKKFSYAGVANKMDTNVKQTITLDGELFDGMTLEIRKFLEMPEYMSVVQSIAETVFDFEDSEFKPEICEFITRLYVLRAYAGIQMNEKDITKAFRVLMGTDLYFQVAGYIDEEQLNMIIDAAEQRIEYYRAAALSVASKQMSEMVTRMQEAAESAEELSTQVQSEDFKKMLQGVVDMTNAVGNENSTTYNEETGSNIVEIQKKAN